MGDRNVCLARELTKKFEEFSRGKVSELIKKFSEKKPKGEFVIVIEGARTLVKQDVGNVKDLISDLVNSGLSKKDAIKIISKDKKIPKNELYKLSLNL